MITEYERETGYSSFVTQAGVVIGVIAAVLIYRIAISGLLYHLLAGAESRPTIVDIIVSTTGAALQLIAIEVLNKVYGYLARLLNDWGKCRVSKRIGRGKGF